MNEAEIRAAIDGLPTSRTDAASWTFFYEEHAWSPFSMAWAFIDELATVWEIMASAAEYHKPGNISPWAYMSVSGPAFECTYRFHEDGSTIPDGDFQEFKKAMEEEKSRKALTANAKSGLTSVVGTPLICDKGWPFGDE